MPASEPACVEPFLAEFDDAFVNAFVSEVTSDKPKALRLACAGVAHRQNTRASHSANNRPGTNTRGIRPNGFFGIDCILAFTIAPLPHHLSVAIVNQCQLSEIREILLGNQGKKDVAGSSRFRTIEIRITASIKRFGLGKQIALSIIYLHRLK